MTRVASEEKATKISYENSSTSSLDSSRTMSKVHHHSEACTLIIGNTGWNTELREGRPTVLGRCNLFLIFVVTFLKERNFCYLERSTCNQCVEYNHLAKWYRQLNARSSPIDIYFAQMYIYIYHILCKIILPFSSIWNA